MQGYNLGNIYYALNINQKRDWGFNIEWVMF